MLKQILPILIVVLAIIGLLMAIVSVYMLSWVIVSIPSPVTVAPTPADGVAACLAPGTKTTDWEKLPVTILLPDGTKVGLLPVKTEGEPALQLMVGRNEKIIYSDVTDKLPRGVAVTQELHVGTKIYGPFYVLYCGDYMYVNRTYAKIH